MPRTRELFPRKLTHVAMTSKSRGQTLKNYFVKLVSNYMGTARITIVCQKQIFIYFFVLVRKVYVQEKTIQESCEKNNKDNLNTTFINVNGLTIEDDKMCRAAFKQILIQMKKNENNFIISILSVRRLAL